MSAVIHIAGPMTDAGQSCTRCGYRIRKAGNAGYAVGAEVCVLAWNVYRTSWVRGSAVGTAHEESTATPCDSKRLVSAELADTGIGTDPPHSGDDSGREDA